MNCLAGEIASKICWDLIKMGFASKLHKVISFILHPRYLWNQLTTCILVCGCWSSDTGHLMDSAADKTRHLGPSRARPSWYEMSILLGQSANFFPCPNRHRIPSKTLSPQCLVSDSLPPLAALCCNKQF